MAASKKSFVLKIVLILFCAVCGFAGLFLFSLTPVSKNEKAFVERISVASGSTVRKVAFNLKEKGLIRNEKSFYIASRFASKKGFVLKSGVYYIKSSMNVKEILSVLSSGLQEYIKVSIPEGLTVSKIAQILDEKGITEASDFIRSCSDEKIISSYGIPSHSMEGFLFPDTYFLVSDMDSELVVRTFADNFFKKMSENGIDFSSMPKEDFYSAVTLASIVEKEYRVENEAPLIASVFKNRIKVGSGLYSCATIEYIITEIQGQPHPDVITFDDLKIDSPYNTYKWAGLTPTPISNPGLVAIKAAVDTPETSYFYFTLTDAEKGTHTFTTNFDAHVNSSQNMRTKKSR